MKIPWKFLWNPYEIPLNPILNPYEIPMKSHDLPWFSMKIPLKSLWNPMIFHENPYAILCFSMIFHEFPRGFWVHFPFPSTPRRPDALGLQECDSPSEVRSRSDGAVEKASEFQGAQGAVDGIWVINCDYHYNYYYINPDILVVITI